MEERQRRSFTDDYKRQAVDLVASSGRSIGSVAKELGLRDSVLRRWVEQRGARLEPTASDAAPHNAGGAAVGGPRGGDRDGPGYPLPACISAKGAQRSTSSSARHRRRRSFAKRPLNLLFEKHRLNR